LDSIKRFINKHFTYLIIGLIIVSEIIATAIMVKGESLIPLLQNTVFWVMFLISPVIILVASKAGSSLIPMFFLIAGSSFILFSTTSFKSLADIIVNSFNIQLFGLGIAMVSLGLAFWKLFQIKASENIPEKLKVLATTINGHKQAIEVMEREWANIKRRAYNLSDAIKRYSEGANEERTY
jgi:hypothetical protein